MIRISRHFGKNPASQRVAPPLRRAQKSAQKPTIRFAEGTKTTSTFRGSMEPKLRRPLATHSTAARETIREPKNLPVAAPPDDRSVYAALDRIVAMIDDVESTSATHGANTASVKQEHRSLLPKDERSKAAGQHIRARVIDVQQDDVVWMQRLVDATLPEERVKLLNEVTFPHVVPKDEMPFERVQRHRAPARRGTSLQETNPPVS